MTNDEWRSGYGSGVNACLCIAQVFALEADLQNMKAFRSPVTDVAHLSTDMLLDGEAKLRLQHAQSSLTVCREFSQLFEIQRPLGLDSDNATHVNILLPIAIGLRLHKAAAHLEALELGSTIIGSHSTEPTTLPHKPRL